MELRPKIVIVFTLALLSALLLIALSCQVSTLQDEETNVIPLPTSASNTSDYGNTVESRRLIVKLSQNASTSNTMFNVIQGTSTQINVALSSISNDNEFIIPLYLSVGSFEDQRLSKIITSPPAPYPTLPWSSHNDSPEITKPFEASFSSNPITLKPVESKTVVLTLTALEHTALGKYTMFLEIGNWEQTGLAAVTFQIIVHPKE